MPSPIPNLSFGLESSSDTGDVFTNPEFSVNFGDVITGDGANSAPSIFEGVAKQVMVGLIVAVAAKYVWQKMK